MKSIDSLLVAASCFNTLVHARPARAASFEAFDFKSAVFFGDSYTDNGIRSYIPYANGSVATPKPIASTGGRVWPQYIEQYAGVHVYDYAVSGAVCDKTFSPDRRNGIKDNQIPGFLLDNAYVSNTTGKPALVNAPSSTVYSVWIGTNDLGNKAFFTDEQPKTDDITDYVTCVYEQLDRLYAVGGRYFVILNLAPLELVPQYAQPSAGGLDAPHFWTDKTTYNPNITQSYWKMRQYAALVNDLYAYRTPYEVQLARRYPGSSFAVFDVYSLLSNIYYNPSNYLNGTSPLNVTGFVTSCYKTTCTSKSSWDSFLWYDELHPSEQTDRIIAREFIGVVKGNSTWAKYWNS